MLLLCAITLGSKNSTLFRTPAAVAEASYNSETFKEVDAEILHLLTMAEKATKWRNEIIDLANAINSYQKKEGNKKKIKASHLSELHLLSSEYIEKVYRPLFKLSRGPEQFLSFKDFFNIQFNESTHIKETSRYVPLKESMGNRRNSFRRSSARNQRRFTKSIKVNDYQVNPNDQLGQYYIRKFKIQFAARLILMDNFSLALNHLMMNKQLRNAILKDMPYELKESAQEIRKHWHTFVREYSNSSEMFKAYDLIEKDRDFQSQNKIMADSVFLNLLDNFVSKTYTYHLLEERRDKINIFINIVENVVFMHQRRGDVYKTFADNMVYSLSKGFGNTAGLVQSRSGHLLSWTSEQENALAAKMRPLDVVMEKTPFRLTDKFIPGHYGHSAVWVGTEAELKELDVWNELPRLHKIAVKHFQYRGKSFQQMVRDGHRIIEALRPGVQLNTLRHFMDIDDFAMARMKTCENDELVLKNNEPACLTNKLKKKYLINAFKQVGKEYDFNFDTNTENQIVCSELPFRTFEDLDFNTTKTLGRLSITPDQVALKMDEKSDPFKPMILIIDGKTVMDQDDDKMRDIFNGLLQNNYTEVERLTGFKTQYVKRKDETN